MIIASHNRMKTNLSLLIWAGLQMLQQYFISGYRKLQCLQESHPMDCYPSENGTYPLQKRGSVCGRNWPTLAWRKCLSANPRICSVSWTRGLWWRMFAEHLVSMWNLRLTKDIYVIGRLVCTLLLTLRRNGCFGHMKKKNSVSVKRKQAVPRETNIQVCLATINFFLTQAISLLVEKLWRKL